MATKGSQPNSGKSSLKLVTLPTKCHKIDRLAELLKQKHVDIDKVLLMAKTWSDYPEILTPKQVQELLQISRATFFRWLEQGELPGAVKVGGAWRVLRDQLRAGLELKSSERTV